MDQESEFIDEFCARLEDEFEYYLLAWIVDRGEGTKGMRT